MKTLLIVLGFLSAVLIVTQMVMGLLILNGQASSGPPISIPASLMVVVTLIYIGLSLSAIPSMPKPKNSDSIAIVCHLFLELTQ